jgi:transposase
VQVLPTNIKIDQVEVWFQDETRVGQQGSLTRIWAIKGTRPRVVRQQQFLSTYIYGAVCPQRQVGAALILPYANSDCMNEHLIEISKHIATGNHAVLIVDQAKWHSSKILIIPDNISLLPLPPYSPELNSQENVWQWIKDKYLANRAFSSLDDISDAAVMAWNKFVENPDLIKSIAYREWATL